MKKIFKFLTVIPDESKVPLLKDMEYPVTDDNLKSSLDNVQGIL